MPYKRRYKRRYRRRRKYKGRKRKPAMSRISKLKLRRPIGMPDTMLVKLPINYYFSEATPNSNIFFTWRLNGLVSPVTVSPTVIVQPFYRGYSQWTEFYSHYEVLGSKISCVFYQDASTVPMLLTLYPSIDPAAATPADERASQPYSRQKTTASINIRASNFIKNYISVKKLNGRTTASDNYTATSAGNPSAAQFWHFNAVALQPGEETTYSLSFKLISYIKFFRRNAL